jgi:hypothetical protein
MSYVLIIFLLLLFKQNKSHNNASRILISVCTYGWCRTHTPGTGTPSFIRREKIMYISTFGIVQVFISRSSWVGCSGKIIKYDKIKD